jgi:holo-[acyl-carrier protein] synthase
MEKKDILQAIAKISRKELVTIQPHLSLGSLSLSSSFGLTALRSLLESGSGTQLPPLTTGMTVGTVLGLLGGAGQPTPVPEQPGAHAGPVAGARAENTAPLGLASAGAPPGLSGMGLGLDLQEIDALPLARDYRTDPFYASHFLPSEIAGAMLRPDPRAHLCGLFCAKEAAKKTHPDLLNLRMTEFVVSHDAAGRPSLALTGESPAARPFRFLVSITHTERYAAATCLTTEVAIESR